MINEKEDIYSIKEECQNVQSDWVDLIQSKIDNMEDIGIDPMQRAINKYKNGENNKYYQVNLNDYVRQT